jgi:hypothetical protein
MRGRAACGPLVHMRALAPTVPCTSDSDRRTGEHVSDPRDLLALDDVVVDALLHVLLAQDDTTVIVDLEDVRQVDVRPFARSCFDVLAASAPQVFSAMVQHTTRAWTSQVEGVQLRHAQVAVESPDRVVSVTVSAAPDGQVHVIVRQSPSPESSQPRPTSPAGLARAVATRAQTLGAALAPPLQLLAGGAGEHDG